MRKSCNYVSIIALIALIILPTLFSAVPSITKKLPVLEKLKTSEIIQVDGAVIAGALILLTLTTTSHPEGSLLSQKTFVTADIVFPFAISVIVCIAGISEGGRFYGYEKRITMAGFLNLMISIILLALIGY